GYRMICFAREGKVSLRTRRGKDWTDRFPTIVRAVSGLGLSAAILDGEIIALRADGTSDFQALQNMLQRGDHDSITFIVFDLLYYRGHDLREVALIKRKQLLLHLVTAKEPSPTIRYNGHIAGQGDEVFARACEYGAEGVVSKRAESRYVEGRT